MTCVRFVTGDDEEEVLGDGAKEQWPEDFFGGGSSFVTRYHKAVAILLDNRFSVDRVGVSSTTAS